MMAFPVALVFVGSNVDVAEQIGNATRRSSGEDRDSGAINAGA
jgi:hypothetical protein